MYGDTEYIRFRPFHLPSMQASADFNAQGGHGFRNRLGAMDRARWTIE
jgi:hypothetical protein